MHATTSSESTVLGSTGDGGAKASSVEAATDGAMVRWMTEEDLSYPNTLEYKAHSLADVTQGETARTHIHFPLPPTPLFNSFLFSLAVSADLYSCHPFLVKCNFSFLTNVVHLFPKTLSLLPHINFSYLAHAFHTSS